MSNDEVFVSTPVPSTIIPAPATSHSPSTTVNISVATVITNITHTCPSIFAQHCLPSLSQFPPPGSAAWVQLSPTNPRRFNGEEASLDTWNFCIIWEGKKPLHGILEAKRTIDVAIRSGDQRGQGYLASFVANDISITHCTSWSETWSDRSNSMFLRNVVADHITRAFVLQESSRPVHQCV